jgi:hypothetical protein
MRNATLNSILQDGQRNQCEEIASRGVHTKGSKTGGVAVGKDAVNDSFKLLVTGVTYLDGLPFIGTGVDESGRTVNLIFVTGHCCSVLDFIEASGVMVQSVHHGGQEALAVNIRRVYHGTVGSLRRLMGGSWAGRR